MKQKEKEKENIKKVTKKRATKKVVPRDRGKITEASEETEKDLAKTTKITEIDVLKLELGALRQQKLSKEVFAQKQIIENYRERRRTIEQELKTNALEINEQSVKLGVLLQDQKDEIQSHKDFLKELRDEYGIEEGVSFGVNPDTREIIL